MGRPLPLLLAQAPAQPAAGGVAALEAAAADAVAAFPETRLVVFPEYCVVGVAGGTPQERAAAWRELAEPLDGPRVRALGEVARRLGRWLVPGTVPERGPRGEVWNTALVFSPQGELAGAYRKLFPWRPFEPWTPGAGFTVVTLPGLGRLGLSICYDVWFPEVFRQLAWLGAEVVLNVAMTSTCDREQEQVLARAHAIANQVFVVSVNAAAPSGVGGSLVVDPEGRVRVASPDSNPCLLTDCPDLDDVARVRRHGTCALNRLWAQWRPGDPVVELPAYEGRLDPERWARSLPAADAGSAPDGAG